MYYTIYKTTNIVNGKIYIGKHQTKDLNDGYLGSGKILRSAIEKYGRIKFQKEILYTFNNEEEMNTKEQELVTEEFLARPDVYNLCPGGQGGFGYINANKLNGSPEGRLKGGQNSWKKNGNPSRYLIANKELYAASVAKMHETRKRIYGRSILQPMFDKSQTNETKSKRRQTFLKIKHGQGKNNSQFGTCWITNKIENKKIKKEDLEFWINRGYIKGRTNEKFK